MRKITIRKGFTLIELLIVIALLGALAIGLIGALDPFEQLKKGQDTGTRDLVNQVQTAVLRYYATANDMPWANSTGFTAETLEAANFVEGMSNMIVAGEFKSNFSEIYGGQLDQVWITYDPGLTGSVNVRVCYKPNSKSFQVDQNTKYSISGYEEAASTCKSDGGTSDCYWCVQ